MRTRPALGTLVAWSLAVAGLLLVMFTMIGAKRVGGADAPHLIAAELRLAQLVLSGHPILALELWWALLVPHPPIGALPGWLVATLSGGDPRAVHVTMAVVLGFGFDAYVRLARRISGGALPAIAAFAVLLGSPFTWSAVEQYGRDVVVGVAVLQAVSWAAAEGGLSVRRNALGFGLAMGFAFGSKYTAPMFLFGPCFTVGALLVVRREKAAWRGLGLAVAVFVGVAGIWYLAHLQGVRGYLSHSVDTKAVAAETASLRDVNSREALLYYPATLWEALSGPGVALALLGLGVGLWQRNSRLATALLATAALGGLAVLSRIPLQVDRYVFPVIILAAGLVLALARWRVGLALVLAFAAPRLWESADRYRPGRAGRDEDFDHPATVFASPQYPITMNAWFPSSFSPAAWNLDGAVAALQTVQGDTGTVGLLVPANPGWPGFGHLVQAAAARGAEWDWATVNLRGGGGQGSGPAPEAFVGPLFDEAWPPSTFTYALAFEASSGDQAVGQWLRSHRTTEIARVASAQGVTIVVVKIER